MTTIRRLVTTTAGFSTTMDYLVDFENAVEWDAGTVSCTRTEGGGEVGTVYHNRSTFAGRTVELEYTVESLAEDRFVIVGRNQSTISRDTITVTSTAEGTSVEYVAEFTFRGVVGVLAPLMRPLLNRLGDRTAVQLGACLDRLPA